MGLDRSSAGRVKDQRALIIDNYTRKHLWRSAEAVIPTLVHDVTYVLQTV